VFIPRESRRGRADRLKTDAVLHLLKQKPGLSQRQIADEFGYAFVHEVTSHLRARGLAEDQPSPSRDSRRIPALWYPTAVGLAEKTFGTRETGDQS